GSADAWRKSRSTTRKAPGSGAKPPPLPFGERELAAHPAEELLDPDPVQATDDRVVAHAQHRDALAVELLPLAHGGGVAIHNAEPKLDAHLVQEVGHRLRLAALVRPVQNCFAVAHRQCSNDKLVPFRR